MLSAERVLKHPPDVPPVGFQLVPSPAATATMAARGAAVTDRLAGRACFRPCVETGPAASRPFRHHQTRPPRVDHAAAADCCTAPLETGCACCGGGVPVAFAGVLVLGVWQLRERQRLPAQAAPEAADRLHLPATLTAIGACMTCCSTWGRGEGRPAPEVKLPAPYFALQLRPAALLFAARFCSMLQKRTGGFPPTAMCAAPGHSDCCTCMGRQGCRAALPITSSLASRHSPGAGAGAAAARHWAVFGAPLPRRQGACAGHSLPGRPLCQDSQPGPAIFAASTSHCVTTGMLQNGRAGAHTEEQD